MLLSLTFLILWAGSTPVQGSTYPSWPVDFRWANNMGSFFNLYFKGYTKRAHFFETKDPGKWIDDYLVWKNGLATNIKFSASGPLNNKRCIELVENDDPNWTNNYLCVPEDSPYHFSWSSNGKIDGLDCLKIKETHNSWNDNYLCGFQSGQALAVMKVSLEGLNEDGLTDLASQWENAEQACLQSAGCNSELSSYEKDMQQVANGFIAGKEITAGITAVLQGGKFSSFADNLNKFAPFLGAFGSVVGIVGLFGESAAEQQLENVIKVLNAGFNRMEYRFDRIEDQLEDLENTIISEHFWTRITPTLQDLSNVEKRVDNFFAVSDPAERAQRMADLDDTQYQKVFDAISALEDSFEGNNSPLNLCDTVSEYSDVDRRVVLDVAMDLYSRLIRGTTDLILIGKINGRADVSQTQDEMAELLEKIGTDIGTCDSEIESTAWLGQWIDDAYDILGDTAKNKENELADNFYNTLSAKYYWRDWLVVVYPEMKGGDNHWRHSCYDDVTTLDHKHWKDRYNIMISSISEDTKDQKFTTTETIKTYHTEEYFNTLLKQFETKKVAWDAQKIYENLPSGIKKCKYPIAGVVDDRGTFALRVADNRKFYVKKSNSEEDFNIFALG